MRCVGQRALLCRCLRPAAWVPRVCICTHGTRVVMCSHAIVRVATVVLKNALLEGLRCCDARERVHDSARSLHTRRAHIHTHTCAHGRTHACTHAHTHTHTHAHTHTHTCAHGRTAQARSLHTRRAHIHTHSHARTDAQLKRRRTFETNNEKKIRKNKESMRNRSMAKRKAQSAAMGGFSGLLLLPPALALEPA